MVDVIFLSGGKYYWSLLSEFFLCSVHFIRNILLSGFKLTLMSRNNSTSLELRMSRFMK